MQKKWSIGNEHNDEMRLNEKMNQPTNQLANQQDTDK